MTLVKSILSEIEVFSAASFTKHENQEIYSKLVDFRCVYNLELSQCMYIFNWLHISKQLDGKQDKNTEPFKNASHNADCT